MSDIGKLLVEMFDAKFQKRKVINNQEYENAAKLRDKERNLEKKIYHVLYGGDESDYDWKKYEEGLSLYFMQTYNIDYKSIEHDSYKQLIRTLKLKELGI